MQPLLATLDEAAFNALPDTTVLGKDAFVKNEKEGKFFLNMSGEEAGKLAIPLQQEKDKLAANNKTLLDEKVQALKKLEPWEKLGKTHEDIAEILKTGKTPDVAKVEKEYEAKLRGVEEDRDRQVAAAKTEADTAKQEAGTIREQLHSEMKQTTIERLKNKYSVNAAGDDYISNRLRVVPESEGSDKFVLRVFENGAVAYKGSLPKTPEELVEEAKANPELAGMFKAGTGQGSGADPRQKGPGAANGFVQGTDKDALGAHLEEIAAGKVKVV